jgi:hypothetical protein
VTIVRATYRYKRPPRKRKTAPLAGPAIVTPKQKPTERKNLEPATAIVRKAKPCNDNRPDVVPQNKLATIVRTAQPSRATHTTPEDNPHPAIVTSTDRKRRVSDGPPLQMELPLSRRPAERDGDDYKRLKAVMARRLRANDDPA